MYFYSILFGMLFQILINTTFPTQGYFLINYPKSILPKRFVQKHEPFLVSVYTPLEFFDVLLGRQVFRNEVIGLVVIAHFCKK